MTVSPERRWWLAVPALAVLAAAAWWFAQSLGHADQVHEGGTREAESAHPVGTELDALRRTPAAIGLGTRPVDLELPPFPEGTTVMEMIDHIGDRARAGDPLAACELAHAVEQCRFHRMMGSIRILPPNRAHSPEELEQFIEEEALRLERERQMDHHCRGVGPGELTESLRFSARAALSGHVDSLIAFLSAPDNSPGYFLRDPELSLLYRERLWPVLLRAMEEDNAAVTDALFSRLSSPMMNAASAAVPERFNDPEAARALLRMFRRSEEREAIQRVSLQPPSPEANARAAMWIEELYGGALPAPPEPRRYSPDDLIRPSTCAQGEAWLGAASG